MVLDYKGNEYANIGEMCKSYGVKKSVYTERVKHGWSKKEALQIHGSDVKIEDGVGNVFYNYTDLCKYHNIKKKTVLDRIEKGLTVKEIILMGDN